MNREKKATSDRLIKAVYDINTFIIRSLRLFCCITTLVVCSCFDVCWSFGVAGLGWCPCGKLKPLIHPSSGACDFSNVSTHWLCVLVSMFVGVSVWLGWGGIRVAG